MAYTIDRVDIWKGTIADSPGELGTLLKGLREGGASLEFLFAGPLERGSNGHLSCSTARGRAEPSGEKRWAC